MSSNLPPGVTEGMIPGNRPEDLKEEAFWEVFLDKIDSEKIEIPEEAGPVQWDDLSHWLMRVIVVARDLGYSEGVHDGIVEEQMEQMMTEECPQCGYAHKDNETCVVE